MSDPAAMLLNNQVPFDETKVQLLDQVVNAMYGSNQQDVSTQPSKTTLLSFLALLYSLPRQNFIDHYL